MDYKLRRMVREALGQPWQEASLKGTCWGPKGKNNPFSGDNIVIVVGREGVSVSETAGTLLIHEFRIVERTKLGKRVRKILQEKGLIKIVGDEEVISVSGYIWFCEVCKKRGEVGSEEGDDPRTIVNKIYEKHAKASPGCNLVNVQVLDRNMVKQEELTRLVALEKVK